jgi:hypothetical protein
MAIKLGTVVRQKVTPIEGPVTSYELDRTNGETLLHVEFTDANGDVSAKFFREDEVEIVPPPPELVQAVEAGTAKALKPAVKK